MKLLYIDLFCGAGGTSTGVNSARINGEKCADVIACVNHDANAIASHASNHPNALHFTWFSGLRLNAPTSQRQRVDSHGMQTAAHSLNTCSDILMLLTLTISKSRM